MHLSLEDQSFRRDNHRPSTRNRQDPQQTKFNAPSDHVADRRRPVPIENSGYPTLPVYQQPEELNNQAENLQIDEPSQKTATTEQKKDHSDTRRFQEVSNIPRLPQDVQTNQLGAIVA